MTAAALQIAALQQAAEAAQQSMQTQLAEAQAAKDKALAEAQFHRGAAAAAAERMTALEQAHAAAHEGLGKQLAKAQAQADTVQVRPLLTTCCGSSIVLWTCMTGPAGPSLAGVLCYCWVFFRAACSWWASSYT